MKRDTNEHDHERCWQLLADRATEGLSVSEEDELEALLARHPEIDTDAMDRAATALGLAGTAPMPMSEALRDRLEDDADRHLTGRRRLSPLHRLGWLVAAAALGLAVTAWLTSTPKPREPIAAQTPTSTEPQTPTVSPPVAEQSPDVEEVAPPPVKPVESYADALVLPWKPIDNVPEAVPSVSGEVVWSTTAQRGYLRIRGLPVNDPTESQYQLWISDRNRASENRVSGGVFDVDPEATQREVIVPFRPSLPISHPTGFALTREEPGGVVVSDRKNVLMTTEPNAVEE